MRFGLLIVVLVAFTMVGCSDSQSKMNSETEMRLLVEEENWKEAVVIYEKMNLVDKALETYLNSRILWVEYPGINNYDQRADALSGIVKNLDEVLTGYDGYYKLEILNFLSIVRKELAQLELKKIEELFASGDYDNAFAIVYNSVNEFTDQQYVYLKRFFSGIKSKESKNYEVYVEQIMEIPEHYEGALKSAINDEMGIIINELVKWIKKESYNEEIILRAKNNKEKNSLVKSLAAYHSAINSCDEHDDVAYCKGAYLYDVDPIYSGPMAEEILAMKNKYVEKTAEYLIDRGRINDIISKSEPMIGMSPTDIENSTWGKPDSINRTETSYGISEQWVYDVRGYIYFEDGKVDAIQTRR